MKCFIVLCAVFAYVNAGLIAAPAAVVHAPAVLETGASNQYRAQDNIGNYNFGYDEAHTTGGSFRRESGDAFGNKVGSYGLTDIDGRVRVVNYVADAAGFRADVQSNEPGVEPKDPASTTINKAAVAVAAPVAVAAAPAAPIAVAAPAPVAYAAPAPVAYAAPAPVAYAAPAPVAVAAPAPVAVAAPVAYHQTPVSRVTYSETTVHPGKTVIAAAPAYAAHAYAAPAPVATAVYGAPAYAHAYAAPAYAAHVAAPAYAAPAYATYAKYI